MYARLTGCCADVRVAKPGRERTSARSATTAPYASEFASLTWSQVLPHSS